MINKFYNQFKQLSDVAKTSFFFAVCSIFQKGIQFITVPIFTRLLTTHEYGQMAIYQTWRSFIEIVATLSLASGVFNNGMIKYDKSRSRFISSMQGLVTLSSVTIYLSYYIFSDFWGSLMGIKRNITGIMFLDILLYNALSFWSLRQRFEYKYKGLTFITITISILNPITRLLFIWNSLDRGTAAIFASAMFNICVGIFFIFIISIKENVFMIKNSGNLH